MKYILSALLLTAHLFTAHNVLAHSALLNCFDNADGTFTCQGGYSDGSSATGIRIIVKDTSSNVLYQAELNSDSEVVIPYPQNKNFTILFDGGAGHSVEITSDVLAR